MSKRCKLQKEYFKDFGNYKGKGKYSDDYVRWLEEKILDNQKPELSKLQIDDVNHIIKKTKCLIKISKTKKSILNMYSSKNIPLVFNYLVRKRNSSEKD